MGQWEENRAVGGEKGSVRRIGQCEENRAVGGE
jgi:hypothetical protein